MAYHNKTISLPLGDFLCCHIPHLWDFILEVAARPDRRDQALAAPYDVLDGHECGLDCFGHGLELDDELAGLVVEQHRFPPLTGDVRRQRHVRGHGRGHGIGALASLGTGAGRSRASVGSM